MAPDVQTINRDPDLEWLDLIRPTGLVLSPTVIKERGLVPERQTAADSAALRRLPDSEDGPALPEPWRLFAEILGWDAALRRRRTGRARRCPTTSPSPSRSTTRRSAPDWAVQGFGEDAPWQLLVRLEPAGVDPDRRGEADGWEATPHQRFERLLRETGVLVGVLVSDQELRLIYAPKGETSGWLAFPLRSLATVAGRPMLAGLKLVLDRFRLFNAADRPAPARAPQGQPRRPGRRLDRARRPGAGRAARAAARPQRRRAGADPGPRRAGARTISTRACSPS